MDYICTRCNYVGQPKKVLRGSKLLSFMWWFVIPSIWEIFSDGVPKFSTDPFEMLQEMQSSGGGLVKELILSCIPGACYSIWRRVKKQNVCMQCGEKRIVPVLSHMNKVDIRETDDDLSPESLKKIPFRWEKDVQEYNAKHNIQVAVVENKEAPKPDKILAAPAVPVEQDKKTELPVVDKKNDYDNGSKNEW